MKKILGSSPLVVLCLSAIIANGGYYQKSFTDSGYPLFYTWLLSAIFISMEAVLWYYPSKKWYLVILKFSLVIYSVLITLGAQYFSTSQLESSISEKVYDSIDVGGEIEYYREQIKIQDDRINQIYRQRENDFVFTKTEDSLKSAEEAKAKYEAKIDQLTSKKETAIEEIEKPLSVYSWYAYELPKIFKGELNDNFIRVMFQFFSSMLLALVAPITLTMLRGMNLPSAPEKPVSEAPTQPEKEIKPEPKKVERKPAKKKTAYEKLSDHEVSDILKMMFWPVVQRTGEPMEPEAMVSGFHKVRETQPYVKEYSLEECKAVYDEVVRRELMDSESDKVVMKELRV